MTNSRPQTTAGLLRVSHGCGGDDEKRHRKLYAKCNACVGWEYRLPSARLLNCVLVMTEKEAEREGENRALRKTVQESSKETL